MNARNEAVDMNKDQEQPEAVNAEPLIGSLCPWTKYENSVIECASVSEWELSHARRAASGIHGVLRVLDAHRESVINEGQPLLNQNIEGALFDAATHLLNSLQYQFEGWADRVKTDKGI